jgi:hypothetical protein
MGNFGCALKRDEILIHATNMDELWNYAKGNKWDTEGQIYDSTYMEYQE